MRSPISLRKVSISPPTDSRTSLRSSSVARLTWAAASLPVRSSPASTRVVERLADLLLDVADLASDRVTDLVAQSGDGLVAAALRLRAIDLELRLGGVLQLAQAARDLVRQRHPRRGRRRAKALVKLGLELAMPRSRPLSTSRRTSAEAADSSAVARSTASRMRPRSSARAVSIWSSSVVEASLSRSARRVLDALLGVDDRRLKALAQERVGLAEARVQPLGELALDGLAAAAEVALDLGADRAAHLLERLLVLSAKLGAAGGELLGQDGSELLGALVEAAVKLGRKA